VAVAIAVKRKVRTATKDLNENLGRPHRPWPLVHPLDNSVPTPTSNPETTRIVVEELRVISRESKGTWLTFFYKKRMLMSVETNIIPKRMMNLILEAYPKSFKGYWREI
jgi:hypothetical protein